MITRWIQALSVNNLKLDKQHQSFIEKINDFETYDQCNVDQNSALELVDFLMDYAKNHFQDEESYLAKHQYPELALHHQIHQGFINRLIKLRQQLENSGANEVLIHETGELMGTWLIEHIQTIDHLYVHFIETNDLWPITQVNK